MDDSRNSTMPSRQSIKLQVVSTVGYEHPASQRVHSRVPDVLDEHYYRSQEDMQAHALDYDTYSRTNKTKIFCGEWATRDGRLRLTWPGTGRAAWINGNEHDSDILHHVLLCAAFRQCQRPIEESFDAIELGVDWL